MSSVTCVWWKASDAAVSLEYERIAFLRGVRHGLRLGEHRTYERDDAGDARKQRRFRQMRSFDPERSQN